jgi:chemotaxis family two-component system sensor histidine kinase/response regulator PixL
MNPEIRDQAYQFFLEEAPELLQAIETGLLTLRQERSKGKVHQLMRAAHSLKGGAASVELDTIKTLAHRLEDIFKAFYDETVTIEIELESLLLQAYDCLKVPLLQQMESGSCDGEAALAIAEPIFSQIEDRLGDSLQDGERYIPSSADLGIDIVASLFEVDVAQGLERLEAVLTYPQDFPVAGELRAQVEVFAGFAELLNLPGFGAIAQRTLAALTLHPERAIEIAQLALVDFRVSREQVLAGDHTQGGSPSQALIALSEGNQYCSVKESSGWDEQGEQGRQREQGGKESGLSEQYWEGDNNPLWLLQEVEGKDNPSGVAPLSDPMPELEEVFAFSENDLGFALPDFSPVAEEILLEQSEEQEEELQPSSLEFLTTPSLEEVFIIEEQEVETALEERADLREANGHPSLDIPSETLPENLETAIQSVTEIFASLPSIEDLPLPSLPETAIPVEVQRPSPPPPPQPGETEKAQKQKQRATANLSLRVDFHRLERMNNLVGELAINRNSLSLQNEQLQSSVKELLNRFAHFQNMTGKLRELSDQMVITPLKTPDFRLDYFPNFDSLEMDSYGKLHSLLHTLLEEMIQLEESVDDIVLFARGSNQTLEQQRQMLTNLRDELMWARMLPLGEVFHRFPRLLRDLSATYGKSVQLKLSGTGVLVDKAALEKLYDPLLHLLRNAFDHGIESPEIRRQQGKPEEGKIEIHAYHQGNQTLIEVKDDGHGLNPDKIGRKAMELGWLTPEQLAVFPDERLNQLIFEPGFSTADSVSELSGRGMGLDVVLSQLRSLKGTVSVTSSPGKGTTFTLRLPLTLTIAKLLVCLVASDDLGGMTALALPSDSIEEIIIPQAEQIKCSGAHKFLDWQRQIIPIYPLSSLLDYRYPVPETFTSKTLTALPTPDDWSLPLLLLRQGQQLYALEVNRLVSEQELVIKPFGSAIAPPSYTYGCTILADGTLIPVINGAGLLDQLRSETFSPKPSRRLASWERGDVDGKATASVAQAPLLLVVDDSAALRRTLALTLEKAGYRVLQARDGREALDQLQQVSGIQLVICDIEMPNMNGFEFLGQRRQNPALTEIPVAMLTSRSSDKHRQLAMHLGASAYFTKPYIEQQFLTAIKNIMMAQPLSAISYQ